MRNKKLTYFLLPVVLLVWGIIFYRIFINRDKPKAPAFSPVNTMIEDTSDKDKKGYELFANYADPFLKNSYIRPVEKEAPVNVFQAPRRRTVDRQTPNRRRQVIRQVKWPEVRYSGAISDSSEQIIGLMEIDKKKTLVDKGSNVKDIFVLDLFNDSIILIFDGDTATYNKQINTDVNERR